MGFLMGAYGKLMAGKHYRNLVYEQTRIQSQLRRVTKQVGDMEKMFASQKRNIQNQLQAQYSGYSIGLMNGLEMDKAAQGFLNGQATGGVDQSTMYAYNQRQMQMQMQYAQAKNYYENMFEMKQESMLQPLKDLEQDLHTRKDSLDSQVMLAKNEYDMYKEMEKSGVESLKPNVTGQA